MANLKDIDYGIGKYLEASDASDLPDIETNRKNLDLLHFKVATNNAYALYNFKDGMIDAYQTQTGVDLSTSTNEIYDSSGKYYSGYLQTIESVTSSGGTVTTDGDYTVHKFTGSGNYITNVQQDDYEILVVGGGGAGGTYGSGGGGGGGGVLAQTGVTVTAATHAVVIGAGGSGSVAYPKPDGSMDGVNSTFNAGPATYTGYKGGMGGGQSTNSSGGSGYGSGGGAAGNGSGPTSGFNGGAAGTNGNRGGNAYAPNGASGGGGGGAGAQGADVTTNPGAAGNGGVGVANDILISGTDVYYGGGGGGGRHGSGTAGTGGNGGGAPGNANGCGGTPSGTANTGGGGGGAGGIPASCGGTSGSGGSGIVVIRRPTLKTTTTYNNMTLVSNTQTAQAAPTEGRLMVYEETSIGSTTLDTDLKGYVSRDGGTTYTQTPLTEDVVYEAFNQGGIDSNTKIMLHCDGSDSGTTFTDSSLTPHTVTANGNAHTDTTVKKFGTASAQFDGTGDYLTAPDSSAWDVFGSSSENWTIDFWVKHTDHAGGETYISQSEDSSNYWQFAHYHSGGLWFGVKSGGSWIIDSTAGGYGPEITDTNWHHVALCKVGQEYGIYLDGTQGEYISDSSTDTFGAPLAIGTSTWDGTNRDFDGYMDEIRIQKSNIFSATPVSGKTDTITVPTNPYTEGPAATGPKRFVSGSVDISGQPSGTNMKYKIETLNQSASKVCRLHGASLLWA